MVYSQLLSCPNLLFSLNLNSNFKNKKQIEVYNCLTASIPNRHFRAGNSDSVPYFSSSNMPTRKHENVNRDIFNNAAYGKLKGDPDGKLKYIKSLYEETGQVKFDLEYLKKKH